MPQVLKDAVRRRIQHAALEVFAARGYAGATMTAIATRAHVAPANLYRYYPSKQALFDAVLPSEIAERFATLLEAGVRSLAHVAVAPAPLGAEAASAELLRFWIEHRLAVVILLDRATGTPYAAYGAQFVEQLITLTLAELRAAHPGVHVSDAARRVLAQVFENTRRTLAALLQECPSERAIVEAIQAFRSYQIAGLWGLVRWIVEAGAAPAP
jgi:AcrR family transcriptional regulator